LYALGGKLAGADMATATGPDTLRISRPFGKQSVAGAEAGTRRSWSPRRARRFSISATLTTTATKDVQVRLEPRASPSSRTITT